MFANTVETVVISGKVTNTSDNKLAIRGESFLKEISLKPDGSFSETLSIAYSGTYTIATKENRLSVYLAKGTKLNLTANNKDFYKSMVYTGKAVSRTTTSSRKLPSPSLLYKRRCTVWMKSNSSPNSQTLKVK
jgi:hypothetical protein